MCDQDFDQASYINDIAPDVLEVLRRQHFFERLDDRYCPQDESNIPAKCGHSFAISIEILRSFEMDSEDVADVLAVLQSKGGCCDCEVLYNVAASSRLKAKYWKAHKAEMQSPGESTSGDRV
jgi:hypothetical protein